jgi:translation initiation factor 3 subunit B
MNTQLYVKWVSHINICSCYYISDYQLVFSFSFCLQQFLWRPRPASFLSPEKEEEIAKNLKKYSKKYEAEDQDVSLLLSEQDREKRRMLKDEWEKWLNEWKRLHEEEKLERQKLRDGEVSDEEEEYEAKEVEVEEILDVTEEVISFEE